MMDFAAIWADLSIGDEVSVSNGTAEPQGGPDTLDHRIWRSHNFTGALAEKIDGEPRAMRIDLAADVAGNIVGFVVREGDEHAFEPAVMTPARAHDRRWEEAKAYRDVRTRAGFPLLGIGIVQTRDQDREAITRLAKRAQKKLDAGETDWTATFKNEANEPITVDITAILFVDDAVDLFLGAIHDRSQEIRDELAAALAAGATAEQIAAIDITAGYPGQGEDN